MTAPPPPADRGTPAPARDDRGNLLAPECPTRWLLDRVDGKWVSMVVKVLAEEPTGEVRYAELHRRAPGISQKMLSQTLRTLQRDGLLTRRIEPTVTPWVHYALTPIGRSLESRLTLLRDWAEEHMRAVDDARAAFYAETQARERHS